MIMEVSEKEYIGFYRNKRRQKYLDEQRRDNGDVSYDALNSDKSPSAVRRRILQILPALQRS